MEKFQKFQKGQIVIYLRKMALAEIKDVIMIEEETTQRQRQDGIHGEPSGPTITKTVFKYFICMDGRGGIPIMCSEESLFGISNAHVFDIKRLDTEE